MKAPYVFPLIGLAFMPLTASAIDPLVIEPASPGYSLTWFGEYLRPYQVEASLDLATWMELGPVQVGNDAPLGMLADPDPPVPDKLFYRVRDGAIRSGFDTETLPNGDDAVVSMNTDLGFDILFAGEIRDSCWVNNNGNITFADRFGDYIPDPIFTWPDPIIAAFWGDVDTRDSPPGFTEPVVVSYGQGQVDGAPAFGVNWIDVGYFSAEYDKLNSFQMILIDRSSSGAAGDFDVEFNYNQIQWETGDESEGTDGFGGDAPTIGITDGGDLALEIDGSGESLAFLDSIVTFDAGTGGYTDTEVANYPISGVPGTGGLIYRQHASSIPGRLVFKVRSGKFFEGLVEVEAGVPTFLNSYFFRLNGSVTVPAGAQVTYNWTGPNQISSPDTATTNVIVYSGTTKTFKLTVEVEYDGITAKASDTVTVTNP